MRSMLSALCVLAALTGTASADAYFFRNKAATIAAPLPDAISFQSTPGATVGETVLSGVARLTGHGGIDVSSTGGDYRLCTTSSCGDQGDSGWSSASRRAPANAYVQLRLTAPATPGDASASLSYGGRTAEWKVTAAAPSIVAFGSMAEASLGGFKAKCASWGPQHCLLPLLNFEGSTWFANDARRSSWFVPYGYGDYSGVEIWCHVMTRSVAWGGRHGGIGYKGHSLRITLHTGPGYETLSAFGFSGPGYIEDKTDGAGSEIGCKAWGK